MCQIATIKLQGQNPFGITLVDEGTTIFGYHTRLTVWFPEWVDSQVVDVEIALVSASVFPREFATHIWHNSPAKYDDHKLPFTSQVPRD